MSGRQPVLKLNSVEGRDYRSFPASMRRCFSFEISHAAKDGNSKYPARGAHLDTTTKPAVDSLAPRRRSGERVRERGFQKSATIRWNEPLSPALSPLVPRREREEETSAVVVVSRCAQARARRRTHLRIAAQHKRRNERRQRWPTAMSGIARFREQDVGDSKGLGQWPQC
jgi:hypothetical protein